MNEKILALIQKLNKADTVKAVKFLQSYELKTQAFFLSKLETKKASSIVLKHPKPMKVLALCNTSTILKIISYYSPNLQIQILTKFATPFRNKIVKSMDQDMFIGLLQGAKPKFLAAIIPMLEYEILDNIGKKQPNFLLSNFYLIPDNELNKLIESFSGAKYLEIRSKLMAEISMENRVAFLKKLNSQNLLNIFNIIPDKDIIRYLKKFGEDFWWKHIELVKIPVIARTLLTDQAIANQMVEISTDENLEKVLQYMPEKYLCKLIHKVKSSNLEKLFEIAGSEFILRLFIICPLEDLAKTTTLLPINLVRKIASNSPLELKSKYIEKLWSTKAAKIIEQLPEDESYALIKGWDPFRITGLLAELDYSYGSRILNRFNIKLAADIFGELDVTKQIDFLNNDRTGFSLDLFDNTDLLKTAHIFPQITTERQIEILSGLRPENASDLLDNLNRKYVTSLFHDMPVNQILELTSKWRVRKIANLLVNIPFEKSCQYMQQVDIKLAVNILGNIESNLQEELIRNQTDIVLTKWIKSDLLSEIKCKIIDILGLEELLNNISKEDSTLIFSNLNPKEIISLFNNIDFQSVKQYFNVLPDDLILNIFANDRDITEDFPDRLSEDQLLSIVKSLETADDLKKQKDFLIQLANTLGPETMTKFFGMLKSNIYFDILMLLDKINREKFIEFTPPILLQKFFKSAPLAKVTKSTVILGIDYIKKLSDALTSEDRSNYLENIWSTKSSRIIETYPVEAAKELILNWETNRKIGLIAEIDFSYTHNLISYFGGEEQITIFNGLEVSKQIDFFNIYQDKFAIEYFNNVNLNRAALIFPQLEEEAEIKIISAINKRTARNLLNKLNQTKVIELFNKMDARDISDLILNWRVRKKAELLQKLDFAKAVEFVKVIQTKTFIMILENLSHEFIITLLEHINQKLILSWLATGLNPSIKLIIITKLGITNIIGKVPEHKALEIFSNMDNEETSRLFRDFETSELIRYFKVLPPKLAISIFPNIKGFSKLFESFPIDLKALLIGNMQLAKAKNLFTVCEGDEKIQILNKVPKIRKTELLNELEENQKTELLFALNPKSSAEVMDSLNLWERQQMTLRANRAKLEEIFNYMQPRKIATILEHNLFSEESKKIIESISQKMLGTVLSTMNRDKAYNFLFGIEEHLRNSLINYISKEKLADIYSHLSFANQMQFVNILNDANKKHIFNMLDPMETKILINKIPAEAAALILTYKDNLDYKSILNNWPVSKIKSVFHYIEPQIQMQILNIFKPAKRDSIIQELFSVWDDKALATYLNTTVNVTFENYIKKISLEKKSMMFEHLNKEKKLILLNNIRNMQNMKKVITTLPPDKIAKILNNLDITTCISILKNLPIEIRSEIISYLKKEFISALLTNRAFGSVNDILSPLDNDRYGDILGALSPKDAYQYIMQLNIRIRSEVLNNMPGEYFEYFLQQASLNELIILVQDLSGRNLVLMAEKLKEETLISLIKATDNQSLTIIFENLTYEIIKTLYLDGDEKIRLKVIKYAPPEVSEKLLISISPEQIDEIIEKLPVEIVQKFLFTGMKNDIYKKALSWKDSKILRFLNVIEGDFIFEFLDNYDKATGYKMLNRLDKGKLCEILLYLKDSKFKMVADHLEEKKLEAMLFEITVDKSFDILEKMDSNFRQHFYNNLNLQNKLKYITKLPSEKIGRFSAYLSIPELQKILSNIDPEVTGPLFSSLDNKTKTHLVKNISPNKIIEYLFHLNGNDMNNLLATIGTDDLYGFYSNLTANNKKALLRDISPGNIQKLAGNSSLRLNEFIKQNFHLMERDKILAKMKGVSK